MAAVCRYINRQGLNPWKPGLITYTYENPSLLHLREIKQAFPGVPLASSYGTTETGYVFTECEQGRLHQNHAYCRVDFQPFKPEHGGPLLGRILVTTFHNPWYMLIKFTVGDLVRLEASRSCPCGRHTGLILSSVQGRFHDCTLTTTGNLITMKAVDVCLCAVLGLSGYQLTQLTANKYKAVITLDTGAAETPAMTAAAVKDALMQLYGRSARIDVDIVAYLEPEETGKYRLVRSLLPMKIDDYLSEPTGVCI
jgi:phenylacetate-coenzyme A ligase PaaK-like adenylate-forming protein